MTHVIIEGEQYRLQEGEQYRFHGCWNMDAAPKSVRSATLKKYYKLNALTDIF